MTAQYPAQTVMHPLVDAAFLANPYPTYQALREAGPIHWSDEFFGGAWLLTRHADVEQVLRDARFSAARTGGWVTECEAQPGELSAFQKLFSRAMLFVDAPDHTRIRKVLNAGFRPEALQALVPHMEQVDRFVKALDKLKFSDILTLEAIVRDILVREQGIRPSTKGVWHTAYLVFARK